MVTQGLWKANSNKQLAAAVKQIYQTVKNARTVYFSHVKGHSNHKWNDAADKLANKGRTSSSKQKWEKQERVIVESRLCYRLVQYRARAYFY